MSCFTQEQLSKISNLVKEIEKLSDIEKLLLYLQLPCGRADLTEGKYKVNGKSNPELFTKKPDQETTQTYTWILSHLEEDSSVSLPKQEVYDEYKAFCQVHRFEPLCVADFGKAMKHAFPCIKPRRLGQRGNSKYCYSGLRKKYRLQPPSLLDLSLDSTSSHSLCSAEVQQQQHPLERGHQQGAAHETIPAASSSSATANQHQQQHEMTNFPCCEAINLKIEPGLMASEHNHHNHHHQQPQQQQHHHHHELYAAHHRVEHKLHMRPAESGTTQQHPDGSSGPQATQPPTQAGEHSTIHNLGDYHAPEAPVAPMNHHERSDSYSYPGMIQRFGTPDDDDYNHNYQDLNRPIVSELNPFSEQCFAYCQGSVAPSTSNIVHHQQQQHHSHQAPDHQPASETIHPNGHHVPPNLCNVNGDSKSLPQSNQPHSFQANLSDQQQPTTGGHTMTSTTMTNSPASRHRHHHHHHHSQHHHHHQQQQQPPADGLKTTEDSTAAGATSNLHNHHDHDRSQYQSSTAPNKHPPHLHLPINNNGNSNSLDQFPSYRLNHSSVDCCASPFQSPASTPYPMMGSNFGLSNEIHDYYPSDCIRYAEQ